MSDHAMRSPAILLCCAMLVGCCAMLAGCKLVDQRSFDHAAGRAPVPPVRAQAARGQAPIPPLFVVHADVPDQDWRPDLERAVSEALARKANVLFTVESVAPAASSPAAQAAAMRAAISLDGRPVAEAIAADGAQPAQVEMTAISDPAASGPEVRVYVR